MPGVLTVPIPVKAPRHKVARVTTIKKPRSSKDTATQRVPPAIESDSGGENFDIGGFSGLDDSGSEGGRPPLKPTSIRERK